MSEPLFDTNGQCNNCGTGYRLPSGTCDHCDAKEPCSACAQKDQEIERLKTEVEESDQSYQKLSDYIAQQFSNAPQGESAPFQVDWAVGRIAELEARQRADNLEFNELDTRMHTFEERVAQMTALLEKVPHWFVPELHMDACMPGCPRCQWEAMKAKP